MNTPNFMFDLYSCTWICTLAVFYQMNHFVSVTNSETTVRNFLEFYRCPYQLQLYTNTSVNSIKIEFNHTNATT
jgi:hypothetical protein